MTPNDLITIVTMCNKVNELPRENLSQQQIAIKLGAHRDTRRSGRDNDLLPRTHSILQRQVGRTWNRSLAVL